MRLLSFANFTYARVIYLIYSCCLLTQGLQTWKSWRPPNAKRLSSSWNPAAETMQLSLETLSSAAWQAGPLRRDSFVVSNSQINQNKTPTGRPRVLLSIFRFLKRYNIYEDVCQICLKFSLIYSRNVRNLLNLICSSTISHVTEILLGWARQISEAQNESSEQNAS